MTMPHLMNCSHVGEGWCLSCVKQMGERMIEQMARIAELEIQRDAYSESHQELLCLLLLLDKGEVSDLNDYGRSFDSVQKVVALKKRAKRAESKLEGLRALNAEMLAQLEKVWKWCHQGHGLFPATQCGTCKPILAIIEKAKAQNAR